MSASKIRVSRLAHVHYQHPDLERGVAFLKDFGLLEESKQGDRAFLRGYGRTELYRLARGNFPAGLLTNLT